MPPAATATAKPDDTSQRSKAPEGAQGSSDLLTRADFGLHVTGRIDAISDVQHRAGTAKNGNPYSFYQQTVSVAVGGAMFEVGYRVEEEPRGNLVPFELDDKVRIRVKNPRLYNGSVSFDVAD